MVFLKDLKKLTLKKKLTDDNKNLQKKSSMQRVKSRVASPTCNADLRVAFPTYYTSWLPKHGQTAQT